MVYTSKHENNENIETTIIGETLQANRKSFSLRTVFVPLGFLTLHFLTINIVAVLFVLVQLMVAGKGGLDLSIIGDPSLLNEMLISKNSQITIIYALLLLPAYLLFLCLAKKKDRGYVSLEKTKFVQHILPSLGIMVGVMGLTNLYFVILQLLTERSSLVADLMADYEALSSLAFTTESDYIWLVLGIGIAAPVVEELLFRGIIQGELRRACPEWLAVIIQAIIFAAFHMQPIQSSYVLLPGLLLGAVYAWTKSLWIPIIMHIFFNLLGSLVPSLIHTDEALIQAVAIMQIGFIPVMVVAIIYIYLRRNKGSVNIHTPERS